MNHGTVTAYNAGCRCDLCRDAIAAYRREHRQLGSRSETLAGKYRLAKEAGYPADEARRRAHWADPLREE